MSQDPEIKQQSTSYADAAGAFSFPSPYGDVVTTGDGSLTLRHPEHLELYHSDEGAIFEARELYINTSGFGKRLLAPATDAATPPPPLRVLDVGMGLGLNALSTLEAWYQSDTAYDLELMSLEINPALIEALASATAPWQIPWATRWRQWCSLLTRQTSRTLDATITHLNGKSRAHWVVCQTDLACAPIPQIYGDTWDGWQFIWQDPFSPKLNAPLWSPEFFTRVLAAASADVTLATYSVARPVKDALAAAGWTYVLHPTPGKKRHWLIATTGS